MNEGKVYEAIPLLGIIYASVYMCKKIISPDKSLCVQSGPKSSAFTVIPTC